MVEGRADPRIAEIQTLAQKTGKTMKRAAPAVFKQLFGDAVHQGVFVDVHAARRRGAKKSSSQRSPRSSNEPGNPPLCWCSTASRIPTILGRACARRTHAALSPWSSRRIGRCR